ncbi:hypothetical protein BDA99DRAFT_561177 [Phascolomyces articulosus]|uniref:Oxidoreductase AflY n=1 Tax=Phascolomyces articulosus TaxID=60185 RepID=A0AAD5PC85_9FUNG|nr:hypothetical protein BDA99DRAFT_561177 [Phascolomyces articulosus]
MTENSSSNQVSPLSFVIRLPGSPIGPDLSKHFLINKNHKEYDIFSNSKGHHNHLIHHYLAAYAFGASKERLQTIFDDHASHQRPLRDPIGTITFETYQSELGNRDAYTSYLIFFQKDIKKHGIIGAIRRGVLQNMDMLARTLSGIFHPLIHLGYAIEFDLPNVAAEGLAMAACEDNALAAFLVDKDTQADGHDNMNGNQTIETILTNMKWDPIFDDIVKFGDEYFSMGIFTNEKVISIIREYAAQWHYKDPQSSVRELYTQVMLLCASTGIHGQQTKMDFFLMHCLTSIHAAHTLLAHLTSDEAEKLLRAHLVETLLFYLRCGRPNLNVEALQNFKPTTAVATCVQGENNDNLWLGVIQQSLGVKEPHYIKVVRALALGQILYHDVFEDDLWLKAAQVAFNVVETQSMKEGEQWWDYGGIGFEQGWN